MNTAIRCYLCGGADNLTKDHIPPKSLFPEPRPSDLITVPCCYKCNHAYHKKDEMLRLFVSGGFNRNAQGHVIWEKVKERTIGRKRLKHKVRDLVNSVSMREWSTPRGILRLPYVTIPQDEIKDALVRIVKGLLHHHAGAVPRDQIEFDVIQVDQMRLGEVLDPLLSTLPIYQEKGTGVFRYWAGLVREDNRGGIWVLMFFDSMAFAVFHTPKKGEPRAVTYNSSSRA